MDYNKFLQSKNFKTALIVIGVLVVLLIVFKAGVFVGYRKANFSYRWGENYHRNFGGPQGGFFGNFRHGIDNDGFTNAHGTFGTILKIDDSTLIVKGKDNVEKTFLVSSTTVINLRNETIKTSDLKIDDEVVIIGSPDEQGQIGAKLIRVFPKPI